MTFQIALSGLNAASSQLEVTSNNIANVNTTGFKSATANFADVYAAGAGSSSAATGSGVKLAGISQNFSQGNIEFTENNLDFAISGEGFFVLDGGDGPVYSRAGSFNVDSDGYIVDSNLNQLQVYPPNDAGDGFVTGRAESLQLITSESQPVATTEADIGLNLPSNASVPSDPTFDPSESDSYNFSTSLTSYDSLGQSHVTTMYFVKTATANAWEQHTFIDGNDVTPAAGVDLVFDTNGALATPVGGGVTYDAYTPTGANAMSLTLNYNDTTQYGDTFAVHSVTADGAASGRLTGLEVDKNGAVAARYSNGQLENLGQVILASFANEQGLSKLGDSTWGESTPSGRARYGVAGTSDFGVIQSGAVENSNVNLTEQLVEMISAQRNFEANAQVVSTTDAITQRILNIR